MPHIECQPAAALTPISWTIIDYTPEQEPTEPHPEHPEQEPTEQDPTADECAWIAQQLHETAMALTQGSLPELQVDHIETGAQRVPTEGSSLGANVTNERDIGVDLLLFVHNTRSKTRDQTNNGFYESERVYKMYHHHRQRCRQTLYRGLPLSASHIEYQYMYPCPL